MGIGMFAKYINSNWSDNGSTNKLTGSVFTMEVAGRQDSDGNSNFIRHLNLLPVYVDINNINYTYTIHIPVLYILLLFSTNWCYFISASSSLRICSSDRYVVDLSVPVPVTETCLIIIIYSHYHYHTSHMTDEVWDQLHCPKS